MHAVLPGDGLQVGQGLADGFVKGKSVQEQHRGPEYILGGQVRQALLQSGNREAVNFKGHDKPVGHDIFPQSVDLRFVVLP